MNSSLEQKNKAATLLKLYSSPTTQRILQLLEERGALRLTELSSFYYHDSTPSTRSMMWRHLNTMLKHKLLLRDTVSQKESYYKINTKFINSLEKFILCHS